MLELADGEAATPAGLCAAIGCRHVEVVTLAGDLDMWLDGEGPQLTPQHAGDVIDPNRPAIIINSALIPPPTRIPADDPA